MRFDTYGVLRMGLPGPGANQRKLDPAQQFGVGDGLVQHGQRAGVPRALRQERVAVAGHKNGGNFNAPVVQRLEQGKSGHAWHELIDQKAAALRQIPLTKEDLRIRVAANGQAVPLEEHP